MQNKYDAILYVTHPLNEAETSDKRMYGRKTGSRWGSFGTPHTSDDPRMHNSFTFGNAVRQSLGNLGNGFACQVTDFKKWVVVTISHSNVITGKLSSKTFLVVFQESGDGIVLSTHNRYRTISGVEQACSYIRSACSALQSETQNRVG